MKLPPLKTLASVLLLALPFNSAIAQQSKLMDIRWADLAKAKQLQGGTIVDEAGGDAVLKVENPEGTARTVSIATLSEPKITADFYLVTGEVRYEAMEG